MLIGMPEVKPSEPAGRFAEAIAKGREKRAAMNAATVVKLEQLFAPKLPEERSE